MTHYYCWDFDQTWVVPHTHYSLQDKTDKPGYEKTIDERLAITRNPKWLKNFIEKTTSEGAIHVISSANRDPAHVAAYVTALFGPEKTSTMVPYISCIPEYKSGEDSKKNGHMLLSLEAAGVDTSKVHPEEMTLIDDDFENCFAAHKVGRNVIHAKVGSDTYMTQLDAHWERCKARAKEKVATSSSSPHTEAINPLFIRAAELSICIRTNLFKIVNDPDKTDITEDTKQTFTWSEAKADDF